MGPWCWLPAEEPGSKMAAATRVLYGGDPVWGRGGVFTGKASIELRWLVAPGSVWHGPDQVLYGTLPPQPVNGLVT